jgi:hypothetical protein
MDACLAFYAKNVQLLQTHMNAIPAEIIQQIYNHMITNNLLSPKDLHLFRNSMHQMTIDGSVENGEDFLATYCSVQRNYNTNNITEGEDNNNNNNKIPNSPSHTNKYNTYNKTNNNTNSNSQQQQHSNNTNNNETYSCSDTPNSNSSETTNLETNDDSNNYFNINSNGGNNITCNNNYFYGGEYDYHLHVLFGKSIQTSLFDLKDAHMVTDLALDDFEDDQILSKLPSNLKHLSVRWCKLSGDDSLSFLNGKFTFFLLM